MIHTLRDLAVIADRANSLIAASQAPADHPPPLPTRTHPPAHHPYQTAQNLPALGKPCPVISLYSFKGGVGKTTLTVHAAHYFANIGYRVLLADYDPQASATAYHHVDTAANHHASDHSRAFLLGLTPSLRDAVRPTHLPNLHIIPASMRLHDCDIALSIDLSNRHQNRIYRIRNALSELSHEYDLIFIDGPPALASLGLSILAASQILIVPMRPTMLDCASTSHLLNVLLTYTEQHHLEIGPYRLIKILTNGGTSTPNSTDQIIRETLTEAFHPAIFSTHMIHSAEITATTTTFQTVYQTNKPMRSPRTRQRCLKYLDAVNAELHHHLQHAH